MTAIGSSLVADVSLTTDKPRVPAWVRQARELLHDRCRERLYLADVARVVGVHRVHLAQSFRRAFGETIGDFTRQRRVWLAAECLSETDQSLAEIALMCGFYDQSHFNRVFKRYARMTPGEYRARFGQISVGSR